MKNWKVTAKLFMDANHIKTVYVSSNTARKAGLIAEETLRKAYPKAGNMIEILSVKEDDFPE